MYNLKGKNIIVTGSEGLLGKNIVKNLQKNYANILMIDIKNKTINKNKKNYYKCDLTNKNSVLKISKEILKRYKYINGLINCASVQDKIEDKKNYLNSKFENLSLSSWDHMIKGNLNSMFICSQVFGKYLIKRKKSFIVNFSSTYGMVGPDNKIYKDKNNKQIFYKNPAYPTAKGAVISFTKYLASYWGHTGLRVNCISPGFIKTAMTDKIDEKFKEIIISKIPSARLGEPEDVANAVIFLVSPQSDYINGETLHVNGGMYMA